MCLQCWQALSSQPPLILLQMDVEFIGRLYLQVFTETRSDINLRWKNRALLAHTLIFCMHNRKKKLALISNWMNGRLTSICTQKPLKQSTERLSSLQKVNEKILETVFELKKVSEAARFQYPTFPSFNCPTVPFILLSWLILLSSSPFSLLHLFHHSSLLTSGTLRIENQTRIDWERKEKSEILAEPLEEKLASGRGEPVTICYLD